MLANENSIALWVSTATNTSLVYSSWIGSLIFATSQLLHPNQGCMNNALVRNDILLSGFALMLYVCIILHT